MDQSHRIALTLTRRYANPGITLSDEKGSGRTPTEPFGARAASDWGVPRTVQSWGICVGTRPGCEWHGGVSWAAWAVLGLQPCALDERPKIARAAGLRASRAVVCSDPAIPPARLAELVTRAEGSNREISPVTAPTAAALAART